MEPAQLIAIAGSIGTLLASAIGVMYKGRIDSMKEHLTAANETIEYERKQKEASLERGIEREKETQAAMSERERETLIGLNELLNTVGALGPVVTNDGGKTRSHVSAKASEVVALIKD